MSSAKRVHKSASTYTSGCPVSLSKLTLKRSAKQLRYSVQSPRSSARPKFSMTRSISARVQSVSIICSREGPALPSFIARPQYLIENRRPNVLGSSRYAVAGPGTPAAAVAAITARFVMFLIHAPAVQVVAS